MRKKTRTGKRIRVKERERERKYRSSVVICTGALGPHPVQPDEELFLRDGQWKRAAGVA